MLKNYTTRIRNIKVGKLQQFLKYLENDNHKNHTKHNTKIQRFGDLEKLAKIENEMIEANMQNRKNRPKNKMGKKLKVSNKSLTFNLPVGYEVNFTQMQEINRLLILNIQKHYKENGFNISKERMVSVCHLQENSHLHTILPYLDNEGNPMRFVKSKKFTLQLKFLFTHITDSVLKTNYKDYKPLTKPQAEHNKVIDQLEELKAWYESMEETKYYKNQIIAIERLIKANPKEKTEKVQQLFNNSEKAEELRKTHKMKTPVRPKLQ